MNRLLILACCAISVACMPLFAQNNMPVLAQFQGEHNASGFGVTMESIDFNHDGYDDLVVWSQFYGYHYSDIPSRGKVYVYYGGPEFGSDTQAAMTLEGDYPLGEQMKISGILNCGDVNGDGFDDLGIRESFQIASDSIKVLIYYGGVDNLDQPDYCIEHTEHFYVTPTFTQLGDVNNDGYDDIGYVYLESQVMWYKIIWGGDYSQTTVLSEQWDSANLGSLEGIGDVNNDGYYDFTIGNTHLNTYHNKILLYFGCLTPSFENPITLMDTYNGITTRCAKFGDVNGDGYEDFFFYANSGGMRICYGGDTINYENPDVILNPVYYGNAYIRGLDSGDVNGDGYSDVIGASYSQQRFAVWLGNAVMDSDYDYRVVSTYENFGKEVETGDFNGDGFCDVAVSAPYEDGTYPLHDYRGYVFVYGGNAGMVANEDELAPQLTDKWSFSTFPNPLPMGKAVTLCYQGKGYEQLNTKTISLYNLKGQRVFQAQDSSRGDTSSISLPELPSGVYIIKVSADGHRHSSKRIVVY